MATLKVLFSFLVEVIRNADRNKMTASNVSIVFGPNLLWSQEVLANLSCE